MIMATVTIRDLPHETLRALKTRGEGSRSYLNREGGR